MLHNMNLGSKVTMLGEHRPMFASSQNLNVKCCDTSFQCIGTLKDHDLNSIMNFDSTIGNIYSQYSWFSILIWNENKENFQILDFGIKYDIVSIIKCFFIQIGQVGALATVYNINEPNSNRCQAKQ